MTDGPGVIFFSLTFFFIDAFTLVLMVALERGGGKEGLGGVVWYAEGSVGG